METDKSSELKFKPITEGLGFHPFSDGMPYAPLSQAPGTSRTAATAAAISQGAGAVSAGTPKFSYPTPRAEKPVLTPRVSVPVVQSGTVASPAAITRAQPAMQTPASAAAAAVAAAVAAKVAQQAEAQRFAAPEYGFFYLIKRVLAYAVDTVVNFSLCIGALSLALWKQDLNPELLVNPSVLLVSTLFFVVFHWAILTSQEIAFGTSFGKRMFRLALDGSTSAIFLRSFFFFPSVAFGGLGLLWGLFNKKRRCWHDSIVDLQPIEIARL